MRKAVVGPVWAGANKSGFAVLWDNIIRGRASSGGLQRGEWIPPTGARPGGKEGRTRGGFQSAEALLLPSITSLV